MHEQLGGRLQPKDSRPFSRAPEFGRAEFGNTYWGDCEENAVIEHQQHQAGYPTSGISTSPHQQRAIFYATRGGELRDGVVYVIDAALLEQRRVRFFVVNDMVPMPSVPEDDEVILVTEDLGPLPADCVVEVIVCST